MADVQSAASPSTSTTRPDAKKRMPSILYATIQRIFGFFSIQSIFGLFSISVASMRYVISQRIFAFFSTSMADDVQSASSPSSVTETAVGPLSSPSTTGSYQSVKYDVFINQRGCDAKMWAGIVCDYLQRMGLRVFLDSREFEFGDDIPDKIKHAIHSASVHIAILSKNYASSVWCLEELHLMLQSEALIVPVFYCVPPSVPRHCTGSYDDAFTKLQDRWSNQHIEKWKAALNKVSNQYGPEFIEDGGDKGKHTWTDVVNHVHKEAVKRGLLLDVAEHPVGLEEAVEDFDRRKAEFEISDEKKKPLMKKVINTVSREMNKRLPLDVAKYSVGLDKAVEDFERRMTEFPLESVKNAKLVAIVGKSGSGKTTLVKQLFELKRSAFDTSCFLFDVHKESATHKLPSLQRKLLKDILGLDYEFSKTSHGRELLRSRFATVGTTSRFLIILDGIDHNDQLDDLLVKEVLRTDSLIIITSRYRSLFRSRHEALIFEMKRMDEKHARALFCLYVFAQHSPVSGFESLVEGFLRVCDGLPLSLKVYGALLCGVSDKGYWEFQLHISSGKVPQRDIKQLQISYDALDNDEKVMFLAYQGLTEDAQEAFLDICWFFDLWEWETVVSILGEELLILKEEGLVTRVFDKVNDLDQVQVCYTALGISRAVRKGFRITTTEELSSVLEQERNAGQIKGIWLTEKVRFDLPAEKLDQMYRSLRILALGDWTVIKGTCNNRFQNLRFLQNGCGQELGFSAAENIPPTLRMLEWCQVPYCAGLKVTSQVVVKLQSLRCLKLKEFVELLRLPEEFHLLSHLTTLDLSGGSLVNLPECLGQLNALEHLNLSWCRGLKELPVSIGQLQSLRTFNLQFCTKLSQLPSGFVKLKLLRMVKLKGCCSLQNLPVDFGFLISLEDLNLSRCINLSFLPSTFDQLSSLRALNLKKCKNLQSLPNNIGKLPLISFKMQKCSKLRRLPDSIGRQLYSMERLDLSCCTILERIPDGFMEFASLRCLNLEMCENIVKIPEGFGKLNSLQELDLNSCSKLKELCRDFGCLSSLEKLILRNCESLEGEWMDTIVKIRSLKSVDITDSWRLTDRWTEITLEKNDWDMIVKSYQSDEEMMSKGASMVFSDECLLFDAYGREVRPSTIVPKTTLVFVFDRHISNDGWEQLVEKIKALHNTSLDLLIIHIRNYALSYSGILESTLEPKGKCLSMSFKSTDVLSAFQRILSRVVGSTDLQGDYVVTTTVEADIKGIRQFSRWRNISGLLAQIKSEAYFHLKKQVEAPQENKIQLLRALLMTEGRDFFLRKYTQQVKVDDLKRFKLVLLLISRIEIDEMEISILKEMYTKMCNNNMYQLEVVWMPIVNLDDNATWGSYVRAASFMPWLAVVDPWSMKRPTVIEFVKQDWDFDQESSSILVAVDEKGRIINKDAMDMVWRWGAEAYPFVGDAWDDLLEKEWKQLNNKSSLEFLFQNLESFNKVVKEAVLQGRMIWLYGGNPMEIQNIIPALNSGLRVLDACDIQMIYIGGPSFPLAIELLNRQEVIIHENNRESISWPASLSFPDTLRFWRRIESLWLELREKEGDEIRLMTLRKLLVALLSLNNFSHSLPSPPEASVWIVAIDENVEMMTARGKDVINALTEMSEESEFTQKRKRRSELRQAIQRIFQKFQDGVITSRKHLEHPLLPFLAELYPWPGVICDICVKEMMAESSFLKCTVCEDFSICNACMELSDELPAEPSLLTEPSLPAEPWPAGPSSPPSLLTEPSLPAQPSPAKPSFPAEPSSPAVFKKLFFHGTILLLSSIVSGIAYGVVARKLHLYSGSGMDILYWGIFMNCALFTLTSLFAGNYIYRLLFEENLVTHSVEESLLTRRVEESLSDSD